MDIAIIGMAGRFPDSYNIDELYVNLAQGKDSVRPISKERIKATTLSPDDDYYIAGYLEDIDKFDNKLFKISKAEAKAMSPIQRQLLEVCYETFESSGYNIDHFNGSKTAVYVGASTSDYYEHADEFMPTLLSGNADEYTPSTITRFFNLIGNAQLINTACSASLIAVHNACNELILGNADYAMVCGANLFIFPFSKIPFAEGDKMDLDSPDGKSKAFSDQANGMSYGEGVASLLLKPLYKALEDEDIIYAVIKGSAVNNNGARADSVKAVDSITQAELMREAWRKAQITAEDLGYVEAHGAGTALGDALEIEGLNLAFKKDTDETNICPVSTIKSNIGHTRMAAGVTGLFRAVLSLRNKVIFPTTNFDNPSAIIDFEHSAVYVNKELKKWNIDKDKIRYAGVTSLGASGINCHVVLAEAPVVRQDSNCEENKNEARLYSVSSLSEEGLVKNLEKIKQYLQNNTTNSLKDISYTLNTGRKHYCYRFACVSNSKFDLIHNIENKLHSKIETGRISILNRVILIFDDIADIDYEILDTLAAEYTVFRQYYEECKNIANESQHPRFRAFCFEYCIFQLLKTYGISSYEVLCYGLGEEVCAVIENEITLAEGIKTVIKKPLKETGNLKEKLVSIVKSETEKEEIAFIVLSMGNLIYDILDELKIEQNIHIFKLRNSEDMLLELTKELYLSGYDLSTLKYGEIYSGRKIEMPHYQFAKDRCWLRDKPRINQRNFNISQNLKKDMLIEDYATELEKDISKSWFDILEIGQLSIFDDFFEIGGDSLKATSIIADINKMFDIKLSFEDIFDFRTIHSLAEYVDSLLDTDLKIKLFWKTALHVEELDDNDDFFELGGHSLIASQILLKIKQEFKIVLNFEDLFTNSKFIDFMNFVLSRMNQEASLITYEDIEKAEKKEYYKLSPAQKRMYILNEMDKNSINYNIAGSVRINGELNLHALENAFISLINRHETLRTSFSMIQGEPVQIIYDEVKFYIQSEKSNEENIISKFYEFVCPLHLEQAPLLKVKILKIDEETNILFYNTHHIIFDGSSMGIMMSDISKLYNGAALKKLTLQYKDYSEWINKQYLKGAFIEQEKFWLNMFAEDVPVLNLPIDYPRPLMQSFEGDCESLTINSDITLKIMNLVKSTGTTLYMVLLSAFNIMLAKYSGQDDIVIGSPIEGRNYIGVEGLIGMFANTIALRNRLDRSKKYREFLKSIKVTALQAYENQDYQFEELVNKLDIKRDLSRNPLFDVMFVLQNEGNHNDIHLDNLDATICNIGNNSSKFDLLLDVYEEQNEIILNLEYCTKLFRKETIARMLQHLHNILKEISVNDEILIKDINMLNAREIDDMMKISRGAEMSYPKDQSIVQFFEEQVEKAPNHIAVNSNGIRLSYKELNEYSNQYARLFKENGVNYGDIVALMMERSADFLVILLAALKVGATYVSIDLMTPFGRIKYILEDSSAVLLVTDKKNSAVDFFDNKVCIEDVNISKYGKENLNQNLSPEDLLYLIYTSGTTGSPKSVMITNRNMLNLINHEINFTNIEFSSKVLQFATINFDVCYQEIFSTLLNGGELCIIDDESKKDVNRLFEYIEEQNIATVFLPTSYLKYIISEKDYIFQFAKCINDLILAGEQLILNDEFINYAIRHNLHLHNHYGPSETHVVTMCEMDAETITQMPHIGRPIANNSIYILSADKQIQPIGVSGEIYISGDNVGKGYRNSPAFTNEKFIIDPFNMNKGTLMYKTGDLAKWLPDGNIEFLGRADYQLKIRGFRVEIGEVENALLTLDHINEVCIVAKADKRLNKYMCAYFVADKKIDIAEIKVGLSSIIPSYMIPSYFIQLESMPLTINGKINRNKLPEIVDYVNQDETVYKEPNNDTERKLLNIWKDILEIDYISISDNFFDLGGHSLSATILMARIHQTFNIEISLSVIFSCPTIIELGNYISNADINQYLTLEKAELKEYYKVSPSQKRMYILSQKAGTSSNYNMTSTILLEGKIDKNQFNKCFQELIVRHESLRTAYIMKDGKILQKILEDISFEVDFMNVKETEVDAMIKDFIRPFDLEYPPLIKMKLLSVTENKHILISDMSHIISDGVSMKVLMDEFSKLYIGAKLPALLYQYKDYSEWKNKIIESNSLDKQEKYWTSLYEKEVLALNMPTDFIRAPERNYDGATYSFEINCKLTQGLRKISLENGTTMFMNLLAVYYVLLYKITGQNDIVVGMPIAGRNHPDLQKIVGVFLNTLALRNKLNGKKSFHEFLNEVRTNCLDAYENQDYPFEMLLDKLNLQTDINRSPLFDSVFNSQDVQIIKNEIISPDGNIVLREYDFDRKKTTFELIFFLYEHENEIIMKCDYSTNLFKESTIAYIMKEYLNLIQQITEDPNKEIEEYSAFLPSSVMYNKNKICPGVAYHNCTREEAVSLTLVEKFEQTVMEYSESIAVKDGKYQITYSGLNQKANKIANYILSKVEHDIKNIAILFEHGIGMIEGMLGVLKANKTYVALDPSYPKKRLQCIVEDSESTVIITNNENIKFAQELTETSRASVISIDREMEDVSNENLGLAIDNKQTAYIIYTSGSTGKPKGVIHSHYNTMNYVCSYANELHLSNMDRMAMFTSYSHAVAVIDIFSTLLVGGTIYPYDLKQEKNMLSIDKWLNEEKITVYHSIPQIFRYCVGRLKSNEQYKYIRLVLLGGEAVYKKDVNLFRTYFNEQALLVNVLGASEILVGTVYFVDKHMNINGEMLPVGYEIEGIKIHLLDERGNEVPIFFCGEIVYESEFISQGYYNNPVMENVVFSKSTDNIGVRRYHSGDLGVRLASGAIEYIGRKDHQIKIRGYRVELGELESRLINFKGIKEVAVITEQDDSNENYLIVFYTVTQKINLSELKAMLVKEIPNYMMPRVFIQLDNMPLTPNGKIDRKKLVNFNHETDSNEKGDKMQGNHVMGLLIAMCKYLLKIEHVTHEDCFFDIGGHSINAVEFIEMIHKNFSVSISLQQLFDMKSIAEIAEYIENNH